MEVGGLAKSGGTYMKFSGYYTPLFKKSGGLRLIFLYIGPKNVNEKRKYMFFIRETTREDLANVQSLWADGDVMKFVGFPEGLHLTEEEMQDWYKWISSERPLVNHYSIFEDDIYCGESFYEIDTEHGNSAALDIKLFGFARGKGIAAKALSFAIEEAFKNGAERVWVDPNPENEKAIALYKRLGFIEKAMPAHLKENNEMVSVYMEKEAWK